MAAGATVLVTGSSDGGLGSAFCKSFHRAGCRVFASARTLESMKELQGLGIETLILDVTKLETIKEAVAHIEQTTGRLDIVVNNAGFALYGPTIELSRDDMLKQFETNVFGVILVCQTVAPLMIKQRSGKIINIGSVVGLQPLPFSGAYNASKAALHSFSNTLRMELQPFGIKVSVVAPGGIKTEIVTKSQRPSSRVTESYYKPIAEEIEHRANTSQQNPTPALEFADLVVRSVLRVNPAAYIVAGNGSLIMRILSILPTFISDFLLMSRAGLYRLGKILSKKQI